jgi:C1A family cysteine protease
MPGYGRLPHTRDSRDYIGRYATAYTGAYVDLADGFPEVWDQGQLGSCVAFGSTAALAFARRKLGLAELEPSQLFTYFAARKRAGYPTDQDTGLEIRDGFASLAKDGTPPAGDWPYDVTRFADEPPTIAWAEATGDEAAVYGAVAPAHVDDMIASGYPVTIGFEVFDSFESDELANTGVMPVPGPGEQSLGGHCVVLCSTPRNGSEIGGVPDRLYRKARNSWSPGWGQAGYFWFPVPAMTTASDFWQITTVNDRVVPVPPPSPTPGPAVSAEAQALAAALHGDHNWVEKNHFGHTGTVARKARTWLASEGL